MRSSTTRVSLLLAAGALAACEPATPDATLPRGSLQGVDVSGYFYATTQDNLASTESWTSPAAARLTPLDISSSQVVLGYKRVTDLKANTTKTYRAEAHRSGEAVSLVVTDIETGEMVYKEHAPAPQPATGGLDIQQCITDHDCAHGSALRCEANRTCQPQFSEVICCDDGDICVSIHLITRPTKRACLIADPLPDDLDAFVLLP